MNFPKTGDPIAQAGHKIVSPVKHTRQVGCRTGKRIDDLGVIEMIGPNPPNSSVWPLIERAKTGRSGLFPFQMPPDAQTDCITAEIQAAIQKQNFRNLQVSLVEFPFDSEVGLVETSLLSVKERA